MTTYEVHSYHLNIGVGDCAVHLLVNTTANAKDIVASVLIDGGVKASGTIIRDFCDSFGTGPIPRYTQRANNANVNGVMQNLAFSAIIVTHWDKDHFGGIV